MAPLRIYFSDLAYQSVGLSSEMFPLKVEFIAAYCKKIHGEEVEVKLFKYLKYLDNVLYETPLGFVSLKRFFFTFNERFSARGILSQPRGRK
jgi:hypothetical protein